MPSIWGTTPKHSVEAECARAGLDAVVSRCIAVLSGDEVEAEFLLVIGGPGARTVLAGGEGGAEGYWPRAWAARALLYAWDGRAVPAVLSAASDDSWRVREMALKVIARHRIDEALDLLPTLLVDAVPRVRAAAARAQRQLTA